MARITRRVSSSCADCGVNMRISISMVVVGWLAVLPVGLEWSGAPAWGQTPPAQTPPADQKPPSGQKPPAQPTPPTPTTATEPQQSQEKAPPDEAAESPRSLFASEGNQA